MKTLSTGQMVSKRNPKSRYYTRKIVLFCKIKCCVCGDEVKLGEKYFSTNTRQEWHERCDVVNIKS